MILLYTFSALILAATIVLLVKHISLGKKFASFEQELATLRDRAMHSDESPLVPDLSMLVRLKDPLAVARRESTIAKVAATPAPHIVKRKCYEQVVAETYENFAEREIEVEIELVAV